MPRSRTHECTSLWRVLLEDLLEFAEGGIAVLREAQQRAAGSSPRSPWGDGAATAGRGDP